MHARESAWESSRRDSEFASLEEANGGGRRLTAELNQIFRRLRHYEKEEQWFSAVRDGLLPFAKAFVLFALRDGVLVMRAQHNISLESGYELPLSAGRAFAAAVESRDSVIALRTAGEVGPALSAESPSSRVQLVPITNGERIAALIFAPQDDILDANALELVAGMASAVLAHRGNQSMHAQIAPAMHAQIGSAGMREASPAPEKVVAHPASHLAASDRLQHARARRFARVTVARMQLARPEACRAGREQNTFYSLLRPEIDRARDEYRKQFMTGTSMIDYLHHELMKTAAGGDEARLGADYPGALA